MSANDEALNAHSKTRRRFKVIAGLASFAGLCLAACLAIAQDGLDANTSDSDGPIVYRRLLVPEQHVERVIRGEYLPMKRERFEAMVSELNAGTGLTESLPLVIERATYYAQFESNQLVNGQAHLRFGGLATRQSVNLDGLNFPIDSPTWLDIVERQATIHTANDGRARLMIDEPGVLRFDWSRQDSRAAFGQAGQPARFELSFPRAVQGELFLDLPDGFTPICEGSIRVERVSTVSETPLRNDSIGRWRIELPLSGVLQISIAGNSNENQNRIDGDFQIENRFSVLRDTINALYLVRLEPKRSGIREIRFDIPDNVYVQDVRSGDSSAEFTIDRMPDGTRQLNVIGLPTADLQSHTIRIHAVAAIDLANHFNFPFLHPLNWNWSEEATEISHTSEEILEIHSITSASEPELTWDSTENRVLRRFHHYDENSEVAASINASVVDLVVQQATVVTTAAGAMTATTHAHIQSRRGERYEMEFDLPSNWLASSVNAFPVARADTPNAAVTLPINVVDRWWSEAIDANSQRIRVRLSRPVAPGSPLRFSIMSSRVPFPEQFESLGIRELQQPTFIDSYTVRNVLAVTADAPYRYRFAGDERCQRLEREDIPDTLDNLVPAIPFDLLTELNADAEGLTAQVEVQPIAIVKANLDVDVLVSPGRITEAYTITCDPQSGKIDHLEVQFSEPRLEEMKWTLESLVDNDIRAQRIEYESSESSEVELGEAWRIDLLVPVETRFTLRATRVIPYEGEQVISLPSTRRALPQVGRVTIRSRGVSRPKVILEGLESRPPPIADDVGRGEVIGAFGYSPGIADRARLAIVREEAATDSPNYWIVGCAISSTAQRDRILHEVSCRVESPSEALIGLKLPDGATLGRVNVSDGNVAALADAESKSEYVLHVTGQQSQQFDLDFVYSTPIQLPGVFGEVTLPVFSFDSEVMHSNWRVFLPDGYAGAWPDRSIRRSDGYLNAVLQRLFEPVWKDRAPSSDACHVVDFELSGLAIAHSQDSSNRRDKTGAPMLRVYNLHALRFAQYILIGVAFVVGWRLRHQSVRLGTCSVLTMAAIALVVPIEAIPWMAAVFLGCLLGYLFQWNAELCKPSGVEVDSTRSSRSRQAVAAGSALLMIALASQALKGGEQDDERESAPEAIRYADIVFPVDENNQPVDDLIYVPRDFYERLLEMSKSADVLTSNARISEVDYRIAGIGSSSAERNEALEVTARIQIETSSRSTLVSIPFDLQEVALIQDALRLDGQPPVVEAIGDDRLAVQVPQAGDHVLEIAFVPRVDQVLGVNRLDVAIPFCHQSSCRVPASANLPRLEFPTAMGQTTMDPLRTSYNVRLGPTDRLVVEWPDSASGMMDRGGPEVQRFYWMTVGRRNVLVDGAMIVRTQKPIEDGVLQVAYQTIPNWRLLFDEETVTVVKAATLNEPGVIEVSSSGSESEFLIGFTLLRDFTSGIGRISIPRIDFGLRSTLEDRYGLSVGEGLIASFDLTERLTSSDIDEFTQAWQSRVGSTRSRPIAVASSRDVSAEHYVLSQLQAVSVDVEDQAALVVGRSMIDLSYHADVRTRDSGVPKLEFQTPPGMRIQTVRVTAADTVMDPEWRLATDGRLLVRSIPDFGSEFQVDIVAQMPVSPRMICPTIRMLNVNQTQAELIVRRREAVGVSLLDGDLEINSGDQRLSVDHSRHVASINRSGTLPSNLVLGIERLPLEIDATWNVETHIERRDEGWFARVDVRLELPDDIAYPVDACRLRLDDSWRGPFETNTPGFIGFEPSNDGDSGILVLRPQTPFRGSTSFQFSGPLDSPLAVPNVLPITSADAKISRTVVLPRRLESDSLRWQVTGLTEVDESGLPIPSTDQEESDASQSETVRYRVDGMRFDAAIASVDHSSREQTISLCEQQYFVHADGRYTARVSLDLAPSAASEFNFTLPAETRLGRVQVDDLEAETTREGANRWMVKLKRFDLPLRVEIVYSGQTRPLANSDTSEISLPTLTTPDVQIEKSIWRVYLGSAERQFVPTNPSESLELIDFLTTQMECTSNTIDASLNQALELDDTDRRRWFLAWNQRFCRPCEQARRLLGIVGSSEDPRRAKVDSLIERQRSLANQLGLGELFEDELLASMSSNAWGESTLVEFTGKRNLVIGSSNSSSVSLKQAVRDWQIGESGFRWSFSILFLCISLLVFSGRASPNINMDLTWLCAVGFLIVALIWIVWLRPEWIAALFVLAGLVATFVFFARKRRSNASG